MCPCVRNAQVVGVPHLGAMGGWPTRAGYRVPSGCRACPIRSRAASRACLPACRLLSASLWGLEDSATLLDD